MKYLEAQRRLARNPKHTHTKAGWLDYDPVTLVVIGMFGMLH